MDFNAEKEPSWFPEAKVYHNGSHFIAIPHTKVRRKKRGKPKEEIFVVSEGDPVDKKASVWFVDKDQEYKYNYKTRIN